MLKQALYLIAFIGTILAVFWQELNLIFLNGNLSSFFDLITSADEASYLRPPLNFLGNGVWKDNSISITSYFLRPPGYGIYFLFLKLLTGKYVWLAMKLVQIGLYFLTIVLVSKSFKLLNLNDKLNLIFTSIFAFSPCFSGFMYFTITESISPFFTILSTYCWLKMTKNGKEKNLNFTLSAGFLILLRPQLLLFILLFSTYFLFQGRKKQFFISLLAFLPFILWNIRTISIAKEWMGIHPIYSNTNNSLYRPSHEKMTNLFRIWEYRGDIFHKSISMLARDTNSTTIQQALELVPIKYRKKVIPIFKDFSLLKQYQRSNFQQKSIINGYYKGEKEFNKKIEKTIRRLKYENKYDYYVFTPFKSLKKLLLSSHLNLMIFQSAFRENILIEILRWTCMFMILFIFSVSSLNVFRFKFDPVFFISSGIFCSLFYLSYIQRMNEERYLTPIIPLAFVVLVTIISTKIKNERKENSL